MKRRNKDDFKAQAQAMVEQSDFRDFPLYQGEIISGYGSRKKKRRNGVKQ